MADQSAPAEIVIVRRRGGDDEGGHHGGVWKIAYADFMTAMMAFFLVMWLVNASDKKVLTQVANYFNPIKMSDRVTSSKGVEDMVEGAKKRGKGKAKDKEAEGETEAKGAEKDGTEEKKTEEAKGEKSESKPEEHEKKPDEAKDEHKPEAKEDPHKEKPPKVTPGGATDMSEQELFNDPYGILEKLAAQAISGKQNVSEGEESKESSGGTAFRDPFDPDFNRVSKAEGVQALGAGKGQMGIFGDPSAKLAEEKKSAEDKKTSSKKKDDQKDTKLASKEEPKDRAKESKTTPDAKPAKDVLDQKAVQALQAKLEKTLSDLAPGQKPSVSVTLTPEGLLISLTDEFDFEMFKTSSAQPSPQLVAAMNRVGGVLRELDGPIILRGHTDARKFKAGTSDNWVLSSQRALMSRYMLIRGGIPESRIAKVEGYADTNLKVPANGLAAQNRRIEILVKKVDPR